MKKGRNKLHQALNKEISRRKNAEAELKQISAQYASLLEFQALMEEALSINGQNLELLRQNYERLTPREREVMTMIVAGQLNKEIAAKTGVTERTIKFHRRQIMNRMEASSLAELVRMAEKLNYLRATEEHPTNLRIIYRRMFA